MIKSEQQGWSRVVEKAPIVNTTNGTIRGLNRNGNAVFQGIPYGDCCDGKYRFLKPRPAKRWEGIKECIELAPSAMQTKLQLKSIPQSIRKAVKESMNFFTGGISYPNEEETVSENCLVLNIVTPGLDNQLRPTVVYLHGGGYMSGSGNVVAQCCDRWLDEENLVMVTVNHRLNIFGSLYLGCFDEKYETSGLNSQLDLILALQWIKNNISGFGGDPNNVILYGESGGGIKIQHLMAMPEAKGLYSKAIVISGSIPVASKTKSEAEEETKEVMRKLGIAADNWRELLTVSAETLVRATVGMELIGQDKTPFMPTADGINLPYNKDKGYHAYCCANEIPVIVGASEEEIASNVVKNPVMTWEDVRKKLLEQEFSMHQTLPGVTEENVNELIHTFRKNSNNVKQPWQVYAQMVSMSHFLGEGAYQFAKAKAELGGAPVWLYSMNYDAPLALLGGLRCAWHTVELPLSHRAVYYPEQENLSKIIAHAFAEFARTGDPSNENLHWPEFTLEKKETMLFGRNCECLNDPYQEIHHAVQIMRKN